MLSLIYQSVFFNGSGYAAEARDMALALAGAGVRVKVDPLDDPPPPGPADGEYAALRQLMHTAIDPDEAIFLISEPVLWVNGRPSAQTAVLRTMFETEQIRPEWADRCNQFDEVWVPSSQNAAAFIASGVLPEKVKVVPGGVNTDRFRPGAPPLPLARRRGFAFLSVFAWGWRKGWDRLIQAYCEEFSPDEPVTLYLKVDPLGAKPEVGSELCYFITQVLGRPLADVPDIVLVDLPLSDGEMPRLYAAVDALVLPSRGEGYGRPFLEAMACGLPVIGTQWGGQSDFLTTDAAYPVPIAGMVPAPDYDLAHYRGLRWAEPELGALRRLMRHVYEHREEARAVGAAACRLVAEKWDVKKIALDVVQHLHRLAAERVTDRGGLDTAPGSA